VGNVASIMEKVSHVSPLKVEPDQLTGPWRPAQFMDKLQRMSRLKNMFPPFSSEKIIYQCAWQSSQNKTASEQSQLIYENRRSVHLKITPLETLQNRSELICAVGLFREVLYLENNEPSY